MFDHDPELVVWQLLIHANAEKILRLRVGYRFLQGINRVCGIVFAGPSIGKYHDPPRAYFT